MATLDQYLTIKKVKKSTVTIVTVISQKARIRRVSGTAYGDVLTCSSYPKMSDDHSSPHSQLLPLYVLTTCWIWHLTSCRNFLNSHSNSYWKRIASTAWGCSAGLCNNYKLETSWTGHKYAKRQFLLFMTVNIIDPWQCNYCKISLDFCLLCRKRCGDFVIHHKAIYLQPSTCGCVNILHERRCCHQRTALHQKQPFLVRG